MLFDKAKIIMENGGNVESLVSKTAYSVNSDGTILYAEGLEVDADYLTRAEVVGEWVEIYIIKTKEDMDKLSEDERNDLIEKTFEGIYIKLEFDKVHGRVHKWIENKKC